MKGGCCTGTKVAKILVTVGALNWGLVGAFNWNLVEAIFGSISWLERLIYVVVGLAGVFMLVKLASGCKSGSCGKGSACCSSGKMMDDKKGGSCKGGSCKGGSCSGK